MRFTKVHGAGNDFILYDATKGEAWEYAALAPRLCDRHTGIGGDGLLIVEPSGSCDLRMRIINNDGSEAEMCGNGIRAFSKYAYERGLVSSPKFRVETLSGIVEPELLLERDGSVSAVRVNMGKPVFACEEVPVLGKEASCLNRTMEVAGRQFTFSAVRMGVPHITVEVEDPKTFDLLHYGPAIENLPIFPERTNVNFYRVIDHDTVEMRVWERGAGATLACGTGSCATAVLCAATGQTGRRVNVRLALATLQIEWAEDENVYMTGPAAIAFDGETVL